MAVVFLLVAFVCALIATLLGFGAFAGAHVVGWLAAAVLFAVAARIVAAVPWP